MSFFFFFNDTATTEIYTLSLHDALPIFVMLALPTTAGVLLSLSRASWLGLAAGLLLIGAVCRSEEHTSDSSHSQISYAVFCLKKKKNSAEIYAVFISQTVREVSLV